MCRSTLWTLFRNIDRKPVVRCVDPVFKARRLRLCIADRHPNLCGVSRPNPTGAHAAFDRNDADPIRTRPQEERKATARLDSGRSAAESVIDGLKTNFAFWKRSTRD